MIEPVSYTHLDVYKRQGQAREQFTGAVDRIFDTAESVCVASVVRTALRAVRDTVGSVARAVWNWIFF